MVWPTPFLINMLTALKGSQFYFYSVYCLILVDNPMTFPHGFLIVFKIQNGQDLNTCLAISDFKGITPKMCNPELLFLYFVSY